MTNLKVFNNKKELLDSLPALTASDFIIYDTSEQDETKPYVLVSFSFYDEKVGNYFYQIQANNSLDHFITWSYRSTGTSASSLSYYMYDMRLYYYDLSTNKWVLDVVATKSSTATSSIGLKGSINTIIYSTRDIYTNPSVIGYKKDSRFLLSGRFRNDTPFDEFFNESHLTQLGYETGDDILRVKYADNNHLLFVIKGSTSPLKAIYTGSDYYNLTINGTVNGLQCADGVYTEVSTLNHVASRTLPFDDYVLYSTLDITFQDRLMRIKDHYVTGVRDEIVSISPETIQIKEPFNFEVQTNPTGLEVKSLLELPETYDIVRDEIVQFQAGNSYPYEHHFETVDLIGEWARRPLPPKQTVANFYDGNQYRIVYQFKENEYKMLTFNMEEGCKIYWGSLSYGEWYFSDRNKASNFMLYPLTVDGIGEGVSVFWNSSYNHLNPSTTQAYQRNVECIFFSNTPIYDRDKTTILYKEESLSDLYPHYFHLKSVGFNPDCRIKIGETWEDLVQINCEKAEGVEVQSISFSGDYQPTYQEMGTYYLTAHVVVEQQPDEVFSYPFFINIYNEESLAYPNNLPFPPEDGTKECLIFTSNKGETRLLAFTMTDYLSLYTSSSTKLEWFKTDEKGGYAATDGSYVYFLKDDTWQHQSNFDSRRYYYPIHSIDIKNGVNDVIYSTRDIYDKTSASKNLLYPADPKLPKKDYHISMRKYEMPYELPNVKEFLQQDGANHYLITYQSGYVCLITIVPEDLNDFSIVLTGAYGEPVMSTSKKMAKVVYRRFNPSTKTWGNPDVYTGRTSFEGTYFDGKTVSSLNRAYAFNDLVYYTTCPVILEDSNRVSKITSRLADNQMVADESSVAPVVLDITTNQEEPYSVDTKFNLGFDYELEDLEGVIMTGYEWENNQKKYPVGDNMVRVRIKDNRELWSEWFEKTITIQHPEMDANAILGVHNLPLQTNGEPYDHYLVFKYQATNALAYRCWGFVSKEGVEEFKVSVSGSNINFNQKLNLLFDKVDYYTGYDSIKGWGNATAINLGYNSYGGGVLNGLASNIYYSTFPIYTSSQYTEILAHPLTTVPPLPFAITLTTSHEDVWTNDDVTVHYEIDTMGQEAKEIKYRVNNGEFISLTEAIGHLTFNQSGIYTVEVVAVNEQNVATTVSTKFRIDKDAPALEVTEQPNRFSYLIKDEHSGIQSVKYRLATIDGVEQNNAWTSGSSNGTLNKPVYGGVYVYEFELTDKVGNTAIREFVFDLPKINIESIAVNPQSFDLKSGQTQQLTVQLLPENQNESHTITYESLSPYVAVSTSGNVSILNRYYVGEAQIKVKVNDFEEIVTVNCCVNELVYPADYPPIYDLYNYPDYTDFIVYRYSSTTYYMLAFNREDNDAIFYLESGRLHYSINNTIKKATRFDRFDENTWKRSGSSMGGTSYLSLSTYNSYPRETIAFSTIDLYSNATGELLARPKDVLPPMIYPGVRLETNGYNGSWTNSINFQVFGEDMGSGLTKLTYQINNEAEVEVEAGEVINLEGRATGTYQIKAYAYNDYNVRTVTETVDVKLDVTLPSLSISQSFNSNTLTHNVNLTASDSNALLSTIQYRIDGSEWAILDVEGQSKVTATLYSFDVMDAGTRHIEVIATDLAGNQTTTEFVSVVELQKPSSINCSPSSVNMRAGGRETLTVRVNVVGSYSPDEIIFSGYDEEIIRMDGFTVVGLKEGNTTLTVSCRGVSRNVAVTIQPAYPNHLPSKHDIYWYEGEFTDFIVANVTNDGYRLILLNRKDEDAFFFIKSTDGWYRLNWSISNHVTEFKGCTLNGQKWNRKPYDVPLKSNYGNMELNNLNPTKTICFSTVDFYDETGTELLRPKDTLPSTQLTDVLLNLNGYNGEWVQDHDITVSGIDTGGGIGQVTYSLDGGATEIEIENGGKVEFPQTGTYQVLAAVYNQEFAPRKVVFNSVKIDRDLPTATFSRHFSSLTNQYSVRVEARDTHSGIRQIRYRLEGGEWAEALFDDVLGVGDFFFSTPHVEFGNYVTEFEIIDAVGNVLANSFTLEVPRPTPSSITVSPNPIEVRVGKSLTLDIQVNVDGRLEEGEITITEYDDTLIAVDEQTQTITGLAEGQTTIKVNCRGTYKYVSVKVLPAFVPLERFEVEPKDITMEVGDVVPLSFTFYPEDATDQTLTFNNPHNNIVTIRDNAIKGLAKGTTTITVSASNGSEETIRVNVLKRKEKPVINSLTVSPSFILTGDEVTFSYQATFDTERGAELVEERWTGDKRDRYDEAGTYVVGLEILDSNGLWSNKKEVTFTVVQRISIEEITVEPNPIVGVVGTSKPVNVSYSPTNAHNKNLVYTVENPAVATYEDGHLIFHEAGETTLIVASEENEAVHTRVPIQVFNPSPVKLKLNNSFVSLMLSNTNSPVRVKQGDGFKSLLLADDLPTYIPNRQVKVRVNGEWKLLVIEQDL